MGHTESKHGCAPGLRAASSDPADEDEDDQLTDAQRKVNATVKGHFDAARKEQTAGKRQRTVSQKPASGAAGDSLKGAVSEEPRERCNDPSEWRCVNAAMIQVDAELANRMAELDGIKAQVTNLKIELQAVHDE